MLRTQTTRPTPGAVKTLDAAERLFSVRGIHAVGVEVIAAEAGVTKRTLYDRFGSKDALVEAYLRRRHEQWWAQLQQRLACAAAPAVLAVFDAYLAASDHPGHGCPFLNAAGELPDGHPGLQVVMDHKRQVREEVGRLVEVDLADAAPAELGEHLFLLLEGGIAHRGIDTGVDHLRAARALAEQLMAAAQ